MGISAAEKRVKERGRIARQELLLVDGGCVNAADAAKQLGITEVELERIRSSNQLLAVDVDSKFQYPIWQFEGANLVPGLQEILEILGDDDPWSNFIFLLGHDYAVDGCRPIDKLRVGDIDSVKRAAHTYGHHGAV